MSLQPFIGSNYVSSKTSTGFSTFGALGTGYTPAVGQNSATSGTGFLGDFSQIRPKTVQVNNVDVLTGELEGGNADVAEALANDIGLNQLLDRNAKTTKAIADPKGYFEDRNKEINKIITIAKLRGLQDAYILKQQNLPDLEIREKVLRNTQQFYDDSIAALNKYNYPTTLNEQVESRLTTKAMLQ